MKTTQQDFLYFGLAEPACCKSAAELAKPELAMASCPPLKSVAPDAVANFCDYVPFDRPEREQAVCLIHPESGAQITYHELQSRVRSFRRFFSEQGLQQGDTVALLAEDCPDGIAVMLACFWDGFIFAPLNYTLAPDAIISMLSTLGPALLLAQTALAEQHPVIIERFRSFPLEASCAGTFDGHDFHGLRHTPCRTPAATPCVILFSSGSTGKPKAIAHTHGDLINTNLNYAAGLIKLRSDECVFSPSRIFFAYGLNAVLFSLFAGSTVILAPNPHKKIRIIDILKRHRVNVLFAVPTVYKFILQELENNTDTLPDLRLCVSAGEPLPPVLLRQVEQRLQVDILDGIGTTEVLSTFISNRVGDSQVGSTGMVVPGFEVKIIRQSGELCRPDEIGTLWVKGLTVAKGYLDQLPSNDAMFKDGWYNTNDMFSMDEQRRFSYFGRANDVVKINGCWFSPIAIEQVLQEDPRVKECQISFVQDELGLLRPHASVVLADGTADVAKIWAELRQLVKSRLGAQQYPHFFIEVDSLPRTSSGKLVRNRPN